MSDSGSHTPLRWLADEGSMEVFVEQRRGRGSMSESGGNAAPLLYLFLATKLSRAREVLFCSVDNVTRGPQRPEASVFTLE